MTSTNLRPGPAHPEAVRIERIRRAGRLFDPPGPVVRPAPATFHITSITSERLKKMLDDAEKSHVPEPKRKRGRPRKSPAKVKGDTAARGLAYRRAQAEGDTFDIAESRRKTLSSFWAARGYDINARLVEAHPGTRRYIVRSDLVGGVPPGYKLTVKRPARETRIRLASGSSL